MFTLINKYENLFELDFFFRKVIALVGNTDINDGQDFKTKIQVVIK